MSTPGGPRRSHRDDHEAPFGDRDGYQGTGDQGSAQRATEPPPPRRQLWGPAARPSRSRGAFRSCAVCRPLQSTVPLPPAASGSQRPRPRSKPRLHCGPGARSGVRSGAHTDGLAPVPPAPGLPRFLRPGRAPSQPPRGRPPRGRWSLVPTAPGFCLKQRPTAPSHTCGPSQTSSAFCTFSLQQRVCLSRSVRGWAASRWPAWPAHPSPPGTLAPYLFSGSGAPTCKAAAGRGDNAP